MRFAKPTTLLMLTAALSACSGATDGPPGEEEGIEITGGPKSDQPVADGEFVPTQNNNVVLNKGYHALFDSTSNTCVEQQRAVPVAQVTDIRDKFQLTYVTSRSELADKLGIDLSLKVAHTIGSAGLSTKLLNEFAENRNSVHLLLTVERSYLVQNRDEVDYRERTFQKLEASANEFLQACGANYVSAVRYGGYLQMLIVYTAANATQKQELEAEIGANASALNAEATLSTLLAHTAANENSALSVTAVRSGLDAETTNLADLIAAGISSETLSQVRLLEQNLAESIRTDSCVDSGGCPVTSGRGVVDCEPCSNSPGYFDNPARDASVLGVHLGQYNNLFGSSTQYKPVYDAIREHWREVEDTTRALSSAQDELEGAYMTQIRPFLNATAANRAQYNNPTNPASTVAELTAAVEPWAAKFNPNAGAVTRVITDHVEACWGRAAADVGETCSTVGRYDGSDVDLLELALSELDTYEQTGRPVSMDVRVWEEENAVQLAHAKALCQRFEPAGTFRVPTLDEVELIAPMLNEGPIPWNLDQKSIYVDTTQCPSGEPVLVGSGGEWQLECLGRDRRVVLCVPAAGPFAHSEP